MFKISFPTSVKRPRLKGAGGIDRNRRCLHYLRMDTITNEKLHLSNFSPEKLPLQNCTDNIDFIIWMKSEWNNCYYSYYSWLSKTTPSFEQDFVPLMLENLSFSLSFDHSLPGEQGIRQMNERFIFLIKWCPVNLFI